MSEQPLHDDAERGRRRSLLIWLSGADPDVLEHAATDRAKYQGMGGAVLTTATLAALSMFFAMRMAMRAHPVVALLIAAVWFLAILNLDRWLMVSLQRSPRLLGVLRSAAPRIVLALLFGAVISTPLTLQIFRPEVEDEITRLRIEQSDRTQLTIQSGEVGKKIQALEKREAALLETVRSGGAIVNVEADGQIVAMRARLEPLKTERDQWADKATCELTGDKCTGTSHKSGPGPRYQNYLAKQRRAEGEISKINGQIAQRETEMRKDAQTSRARTLDEANRDLKPVQQQLGRLRDLQKDEQSQSEKTNAKNTGLLIRIRALDKAADGDATLWWARAMLFLLITALECLPVFVKVMAMLGRPGVYERVLAEFEREGVELGRQAARNRRAMAMQRNAAELSYSNVLRDERERGLREVAERIAGVEREIAEKMLDEWRRRELDDIQNRLDLGAGQAAGRPLPPGGLPADGRPESERHAHPLPAAYPELPPRRRSLKALLSWRSS
ncbi:DUF4407 domain-containing protein [Actinomadura roseirufa]|uniref:DUF4407 domain-containing protein n=1 Tax=Actinomadura roseirufa TaxID=2094049 RepID=UPI0010410A3A|nr:DUF4407 domain-containing protein [Actinomadura roseirufa]